LLSQLRQQKSSNKQFFLSQEDVEMNPMNTSSPIRSAVRHALLTSVVTAATLPVSVLAADDTIQEVIVTGTRITVPGTVSSSPITSISAADIQQQQQPEIEKILRILPITAAADGQNANNGTEGAATVNLRGLGPQRNLVLIDGKRLTPYNFDGLVDTSIIPTALVERIDIVTGGASAVYGSDAISGALNFILRRDFEGVEINSDFSQTDERDGDVRTASLTMGSNVADGRGNIVLSINWTDREGVQLGARPLGQLGIETDSGAGYQQFLAGQAPSAPPDGCGGPNAVAAGGSPTTIPTRVSIAGGPGLGQFRDDGTIGPNCSVFNFNPYNYYQTPQERFGGAVLGRFDLNDHAEAYARFTYSSTKVDQQVAPSGIFADTFFTPLANPFISAQARQLMITRAEAGRQAGTVATSGIDLPNWRDVNGNNVVDAADDLLISYSRRTAELGARATSYDNKAFQLLTGVRGEILGDWDYDLSFQYGESDRANVNSGYTNISNIANAVDSVDGVTCRNGAPGCVPINLFGGFGTITPEMAAYAGATALERQETEQTIVSASVSGPIAAIQLPTAANSLAVSFGAEYREEKASTIPDECLKLAPTSCLGGAGGNTLPITGAYDVSELFAEAILPIVSDRPGFESLDLELGYRYSDYNITGTDDTYKYGISWRPVEPVMFRVMRQRATRAPNVGELFAPRKANLDNASFDPCSQGNPNPISAELRALCISTGMIDAQVGTVEDISAGQINIFEGADQSNLAEPETANTTTFGVVWTPSFGGVIRDPIVSLDYYAIDIDDVIAAFTPQQILDSCYILGEADQCAKILRVGGTLVLPGAGVETLTTNLVNMKAEGVELGFSFGVEIGSFGTLGFAANVNKYLTHEFTSSTSLPTLDCVGYYGVECGSSPGRPSVLPSVRWTQRTSWTYDAFSVALHWRHMGSVSAHPNQRESVFESFQQIGSYDWFDLYGSWDVLDNLRVSASVINMLSKDTPVVGNEAADTRSNSGNTFPSHYDTLGRIYSLGVRLSF
jgi:iron complex outermembrane recepter protein